MNNNKSSLYGIIFLVLALVWVGFIFSSSLKSGVASSNMSDPVASGLHSFLDRLNISLETKTVTLFVRKAAHVGEYALFSLLFSLFVGLATSYPRKNVGWILFVGLLVANTDELLQSFIVGRSSEVSDVFIDLAGILIGFLIILLLDSFFKWRFFTAAKKHRFSYTQR